MTLKNLPGPLRGLACSWLGTIRIKGNGGRDAVADTKIILDPSRPMRTERVKETTKLGQAEINQFLNAVDRADAAKKPAVEDMDIIRQFLKDYPILAKAVFPIVESTQDLI